MLVADRRTISQSHYSIHYATISQCVYLIQDFLKKYNFCSQQKNRVKGCAMEYIRISSYECATDTVILTLIVCFFCRDLMKRHRTWMADGLEAACLRLKTSFSHTKHRQVWYPDIQPSGFFKKLWTPQQYSHLNQPTSVHKHQSCKLSYEL